MNETNLSEDPLANASREEIMSALFANMVIQQTNMALMFLGKVPHPETGEHIQDLETAKMFIDQLEMLEVKTKGNLDKREEGLLKQSLAAVRMAFVEAVEQKSGPAAPQTEPAAAGHASPEPAKAPGAAGPASSEAEAGAAESESRKKFTKKY